MAYKGNHYTVNNCIDFRDQLKDFLLACGWQLVGPTDTEAHRIAQDDKHARILGWFLNSNGEDGEKDLNFHLSLGLNYNSREHTWIYTWLTSGITSGQVDSIPVQDATGIGTSSVVEINGEQILVGTVDTSGSPHYLNGCTRGYGPTDAAAHDTDDVVTLLYDNGTDYLRAYIDQYALRDLVNPIASSSGTITWALGASNNATAIDELDDYHIEAFKYLALIKPQTGGEAGVMRWIQACSTPGIFTYAPFKSAPGAVQCDIISNGFYPAGHSRAQLVGSASDYKSSSPYGLLSFSSTTAMDVWFYGSKDGVLIVCKDVSDYHVFYYGAYTPFANPLTTTATAVGGGDISAGATQIDVADRNLFAVGLKGRIISQTLHTDYDNNWDRSADTFMGASPGDWANLDADEVPQENFVVDGITPGAGDTGTITLLNPLVYSYKSGALVGEDPIRIVSYSHKHNSDAYRHFLKDDANGGGASIPFPPSSKAHFYVDIPSHRRKDRCTDSGTSWDPWEMDGGRDNYGQIAQARVFMNAFHANIMDNEEYMIDKLVLSPYSIGWYDGYNRITYGGFAFYVGIIPFVRYMHSSLSASQEDTCLVPWDGSMKTFRIFQDAGSTSWVMVGPEIWP